MKIKFKKMSVKNFKAIIDQEYFFNDKNELQGSNGAGKTTVADALSYAVTGNSFVGKSTNLGFHNINISGSSPSIVELELTDLDTSTEYVLKRELSIKGSSTIYLDGKKITQKKLSEIFPADLFLFIFSKEYQQSIGDEALRTLVEKHLTPVDIKDVYKKLEDETKVYVDSYFLANPNATKANLREEYKISNKRIKEIKEIDLLNKGKIEELTLHLEGIKPLPVKDTVVLEKELKDLRDKKVLELSKKPTLLDESVVLSQIEKINSDKKIVQAEINPKTAEIASAKKELSSKSLEIQELSKREDKRPQMISLYTNSKKHLEAVKENIEKVKSSLFKKDDSCPHCSSVLSDLTSGVLNKSKKEEEAKLNEQLAFINEQLKEIIEKGGTAKKEDEAAAEKFIKLSVEKDSLEKEIQKLEKESLSFEQKKKENIEKFEKEISELQKTDVIKKNKEIQSTFDIVQKKSIESIEKDIVAYTATISDTVKFNSTQENAFKEKDKIEKRIKVLEEQSLKNSDESQSLKDDTKRIEEIFAMISMYQRKLLKKHLDKVDIELEKVSKTTGEVKEIFEITYDKKPLNLCSFSENIKASLEMSNLMIGLSGYNFPIFIDCAGEILEIPPLKAAQYFTATAKDIDDLTINGKVVYKVRTAPVSLTP